MKVTMKRKIGGSVYEFTEDNDSVRKIVESLAFWSSLPNQCSACKSDDIGFEHRNVDGNDYYAMKCNKCTAQLKLGQHKTGGTLFTKGNVWEVWKGKGKSDGAKNVDEVFGDDVPF